ncbi:MAG: cyclic nucleotide-binding domain-containing protein, partial [Planctomycetota bacterium]|nr:cyclic nucleotide-binding domain-containing protein [Planctomycetota bacterium]
RASVRQGDRELAEVGPGGEFGEMAALSNAPRAATVVACEDLVCGVLSGDEFRELVRAEPDIAMHLAALFASRVAPTS